LKKNKTNREQKEPDYKFIFAGITIAGLIIRILLLGLPSRCFYPYDHLTNYGWWRHSVEYGLMEDYGYGRSTYYFTYGKAQTVEIKQTCYGPDGKLYKPGDIVTIPTGEYTSRPIHYPPLAAYLIHIMGYIHFLSDRTMEPLTFTAWLIMEFPVYISDFLIALGCMLTVSHFAGKKMGLIAYILMWLCPGILLTGVLWGQWDSWFIAPCVWCVYFSLKEKWALAGIIYGIAIMLKAQSLVMGPALAYFFLSRNNLKSTGIFAISVLLTVLLIPLPFTIHSGAAWFQNCYVETFTEILPYSTLKAFNIWMIDLIICRNNDVNSTIFGITKQTIGLILLISCLLISFVICYRRYGNNSLSLPALTALTFAVTFLFPTKVHERYIIYFLPFLMISAFIEKNYWITFAGYSVIAIFEVTHHIWLHEAFNLQNAGSFNLIFLFLLSITALALFFHWIKTMSGKYTEKK